MRLGGRRSPINTAVAAEKRLDHVEGPDRQRTRGFNSPHLHRAIGIRTQHSKARLSGFDGIFSVSVPTEPGTEHAPVGMAWVSEHHSFGGLVHP